MRPDFHPESLLWAVERWQKGGDSAAKRTRGARLKKEVLSSLPDSLFRRCTGTVFRRLALNQSSIWTFVTTGSLPETISAWTLDIEIAKGVKGGVPEEWKSGKRWFGVILSHKPSPDEVIVNLETLWLDLQYQRSIQHYRPDRFKEGIFRYENSQREVVLEIIGFPPQTEEDIFSQ